MTAPLPDDKDEAVKLTRQQTQAAILEQFDERLWQTANDDYQLRLLSRFEVEAIRAALPVAAVPESRTINAAPEQRAEASSLVPAQPGDPANVAGNATGAAPTATATPEKWCTCPPTTCEQRSDGWCHLPRGPVRDELAFRSTTGARDAALEEAAAVADRRANDDRNGAGFEHIEARSIASEIRALKGFAPASATQTINQEKP